MDREQALAALRAYEPELRKVGVLGASLFGSVARGDASQHSDLDIAVRVGANFSAGGFDYFWQMKQLQLLLAKRLGCSVDIVREPVKKERFQKEIDRDRALAF